MRYIVTGGAGFIGSHLTEKLVKQGDNVVIIDNLNTGKEKNLESVKEKIEFIKGSILDFKFSSFPVFKLSITVTSSPLATNFFTILLPMKPAPPVTIYLTFLYLILFQNN